MTSSLGHVCRHCCTRSASFDCVAFGVRSGSKHLNKSNSFDVYVRYMWSGCVRQLVRRTQRRVRCGPASFRCVSDQATTDVTRTALVSIEAELTENRQLLTELRTAETPEPELQRLVREEIQRLEAQRRSLLERARQQQQQQEAPVEFAWDTEPQRHSELADQNHEEGDPREIQSLFLEVQSGAGGIEANIFAHELFKMYERYAKRRGWRFQILDECVARIEGAGAYERLRYEAGGVRVQRVPSTETRGRLHTSLAFVIILPETDNTYGTDASWPNREDLRIDRFRASGAGGQHVNKTDSAVRVTHLPTGLQVAVQTTRSQHQNLALAMRLLRARLADAQRRAKREAMEAKRRDQIGSRARHERVRTFHFPRNEVVDHRVNRKVSELTRILRDGDIDLLPSPASSGISP
jgi:peptide chain release factor 1